MKRKLVKIKRKIRPYFIFARDSGRKIRYFFGLISAEKAHKIGLNQRETSVSFKQINSTAPLSDILTQTDWKTLRQRKGIAIEKINLRSVPPLVSDFSRRASVIFGVSPEVDDDFFEKAMSHSDKGTLSLDIWDTILRRTCHPDETKLRAARALGLLGSRENPKLSNLHPADILQTRRLAEALVADENCEYQFSDMAVEWLRLLGINKFGTDRLVNIEVAIEKDATQPDPTICALIRAWPGRKIAISDFYLPAEKLREILEHNGIVKLDAIYSSCDALQTKRQGNLYPSVLAKEGVAPRSVLHLGDNRLADVDQAKSHGITALHYVSAAHLDRTKVQSVRLESHLAGDSSKHERELLELAIACGDNAGSGTNTYGTPLEALAIPAFGFALHILEEAIRRGVDRIDFMSREGVFFKRITQLLVEADVFDLGVYPDGVTLEVSRRATFTASLSNFSAKELMRIWSQYNTQSIKTLAISTGIDPVVLKPFAIKHGLRMDQPITSPWRDDRVRAILTDRKLGLIMKDILAQKRSELMNYLNAQGFADPSRQSHMIVDIGWRGTIQDNLAYLIKAPIHGVYLGLDTFLNPQPANTTKSGYLMDRNNDPLYGLSEVAALEFLFNTPGGTVIGYENGKVIRDIIPGEEKVVLTDVSRFQDRLIEAIRPVARYVRDHGLVSADLLRTSRSLVQAYLDKPPTDVASAFLRLEHNETFGTGNTEKLSLSTLNIEDLEPNAGTSEIHGCFTCALDGLRWPNAHASTLISRSEFANLSANQRLGLPLYFGTPALISANHLGTPSLVFLSPAPLRGSGGHRTIYNFARRARQAGYNVELRHESPGTKDSVQWANEIIEGGSISVATGWGGSGDRCWGAVSTIAHSAGYLKDKFPSTVQGFYFVQDHEADFNPIGDAYLANQQSYTHGHAHITIGNWLAHVLQDRYGQAAASAGLGVDKSVYQVLDITKISKRKKQIAFLFQPEKFRRAPEMCIKALTFVKELMPETHIVVYGSDNSISLPFEVENLGLVNNLSKLNEMYNNSRVGLCISATNPSRIPFEMMAAGCVPVDVYRYNNLFDYADSCSLLAYQSSASLAEAMIKLLDDESMYSSLARGGIAEMRHRTLDWEMDVAVNAVGHILEKGSFNNLNSPQMRYFGKAVVAPVEETSSTLAFLEWQKRQARG